MRWQAAGLEWVRATVALGRVRLPVALLALMVGAGVVDAVCFLGLGRVFAANMTGNVALLGFALAGVEGLSASASAVSLGLFVVGAFLCGRLVARAAGDASRLRVALAVEVLLLGAAAGIASQVDPERLSAASYVTVGLLAGAMGLRNAATRRLGIPGLTTTVLTSTLTALAADARLLGGAGGGAIPRVGAALAILGGAAAGALLMRASIVAPLALAAALALSAFTIQARRVPGGPAAP